VITVARGLRAEATLAAEAGARSPRACRKDRFVVVGESPGSKFDKAEQLGVETIDEAVFLRRIGRAAP
jgi:DNA ligase (NAD+)